MKRLFLIIFFISVGLVALADEAAEEIKLYLDETKIISVSNPSRIAIGNPNIADVTNITRNEITLSPKAVGKTTLVLWDSFGEQSYRVWVFAEDLSDIKRRIDNLLAKIDLPGVYTQIVEEESKILLLGNVKTPQDREKITIVLGGLKNRLVDLLEVKEEETVIEIEAQVLELDKDATNTLGLTWPGSITLTEVGSGGLTGTKWSTLFKVLNLKRSDAFSWALDALVQEGKARVLSRPRLACQSGKEAELLVGGEKPIFTTSVAATTGAEGTTVEYKEYGIKLKIKPTVVDEKRIKLGLNVEVSDIGTAETIGAANAPTAKAYPLTKRSTSTELFLNDGQTLAIGGLIKQKSEEDIRKTPFLGDVPVLGLFFRKKTTTVGGGQGARGDTELFITITPKIIGETKETEQLQAKVIAEPATTKVSEEAVGETKKPSPEPIVASSDEILKDPIKGYAGIVQKRILANLTYPAPAKESGFQGTVKLSLHLSYNGELIEAKVRYSSGYRVLDDNALSVARGIVSYPPFPSSIEQKELWIDIPIAYRLD